jgi:hypothetical protein
MNLNQMKKIGATVFLTIAACSPLASHAGNIHNNECQMAPDTVFAGINTYQKANGTEITGECANAIVVAQKTFDKAIDNEMRDSPLIVAALNSMNKDAASNPDAKELQGMYRQMRSDFINDYLKENKMTTLPTKSDGKRQFNDYEEKADSYMNKEDVLSRIKNLRTPLNNQANKVFKIGK